MEQQKKCAHPACKCNATEGSDYCSLYCKDASTEHERGDGCGCGHHECQPKIVTI